jgi:hypothetical protein
MRYFLMVLAIGATFGVAVAGAVAVMVWPEPALAQTVHIVEVFVPAVSEQAGTPLIDSLISAEEWDEVDRQSDCLFDWLAGQVGHDITLERVVAAGYWLDSLGGACEVMGR